MNKNIITIYDNENILKYKILLVIKKDYNYIIYTDLNNENINKNLYAIKILDFNDQSPLPINDDEWQMINNEYNKLINN